MGSRAGAEAAAARRVGVTLEEYRQRRTEGTKWCSRCKAWHPVSRFGRDATRGDGLTPICLRSRRQTPSDTPGPADRRAMAGMGLAWCRECRWWLPLAEVRAGICRPHVREQDRQRYASSPERQARRTTARMLGIPGWWRLEQLAAGCSYCPGPAASLDHFIPVARGGKTHPGNLVPACVPCNSSKKDQDPLLWIARLNPRQYLHLWSDTPSWTGALRELWEEGLLDAA